MRNITVIAPKGKTCPKEASRDLITDTTPVTVPYSVYYMRRLAAGELIEVAPPATPPAINNQPAAVAPPQQQAGIHSSEVAAGPSVPSDPSDKSDLSDSGQQPKGKKTTKAAE